MKLLRCCLIAALVASASTAAVDVEKTVQQVQNILQANSLLPRLTREEIIQLLNDIRAEDAKSSSASTSTESKEIVTTTPYNVEDNEISPSFKPLEIEHNVSPNENFSSVTTTPSTNSKESTTRNIPTLTVVLPYTPRDGSSLQELYTRPPRVEVVPVSNVTPKTISEKEKLKATLTNNAKLADKQKQHITEELQAFLDAHGLKAKPGQDHFLLPLDGFKPLPQPKVVDGNVQLPENILLTYDLISPHSDVKTSANKALSQNNFLYEPLRPEYPFELDTASSDSRDSVIPLDLPTRQPKIASTPTPNFEPIDYDSIKVIPLKQGPNPLEDERVVLENELNKRQTNTSSNGSSLTDTTTNTVDSTTTTNESKSATSEAPISNDSVASNADAGASIADLEDSFGGAAPEQPGDSELPPPRKNGFYWMLDWNSFLEVGDGDTKVNIRFEPKLGDPQMFLPVNVP